MKLGNIKVLFSVKYSLLREGSYVKEYDEYTSSYGSSTETYLLIQIAPCAQIGTRCVLFSFFIQKKCMYLVIS
jgi:hypothetical protein